MKEDPLVVAVEYDPLGAQLVEAQTLVDERCLLDAHAGLAGGLKVRGHHDRGVIWGLDGPALGVLVVEDRAAAKALDGPPLDLIAALVLVVDLVGQRFEETKCFRALLRVAPDLLPPAEGAGVGGAMVHHNEPVTERPELARGADVLVHDHRRFCDGDGGSSSRQNISSRR